MKNTISRRFAVLALAFSLSLTACSGSTGQQDDTVTSDTTASETNVAPTLSLYERVKAAWRDVYPENPNYPNIVETEIEMRTDFTVALLEGDGAGMAQVMAVPSEVYACYDGIEISDWGVRMVTVDYYGSDRDVTVLDFTVEKSNAPFLPVGEHSLALIAEYYALEMIPLDELFAPLPEYSSAQKYVNRQIRRVESFGVCDFIVARLDDLAGNGDVRTAEEIKNYAKICLGLDPATLKLSEELERVDGGYRRIGRGGYSPIATIVGEETRGDQTVVTVRFWADFCKSVEARVVEYRLKKTELDWVLVETEVISDSGFAVAGISV